MMKAIVEIKSIFGDVLYRLEKDNNSIKDAVEAAVKDGANLDDADLRDASLDGADLVGADLRGASLDGAILYSADLRGAILRIEWGK